MPPKDTSKQTLYNNLTTDGYTLGSYADFDQSLGDSSSRRALYDNLTVDGYELGDYSAFEKSLGYSIAEAQAQDSDFTSKAKEAGKEIGSAFRNIGKEIIAAPGRIAKAVKEVGIPQTEEQAFLLAHHYPLTQLRKAAEQEFLTSEGYKQLANEAAKAPAGQRNSYETRLQELYEKSPGVQTYHQEAQRMASEYEGGKDPFTKAQQLIEELQVLRKEIEPTEELYRQGESYDLNTNDPKEAERMRAEYEVRVKDEKELRDRIMQLNSALSVPLKEIAEKGLQAADGWYRKLDEESVEKRGLPLSKSPSRFTLERYGDGSRQDFDFLRRKELLERVRTIYTNLKERAETPTENGFGSLLDGIAQNDWEDILTLGLSSMAENFDLLGIAKRAEQGENVSDEEKHLLETYGLYNSLASHKELPATYGIGQAFIQSLPFMAEIAATGGLRTAIGKGVSSAVGKGLVKALPKLSPKAVNAIAKGAGYTTGALAAAPIQPMTYGTTAERQLGNYGIDAEGNVTASPRAESLAESFGWAGLSTLTTLMAEDGLGPFAQGLNKGAKGIGKLLGVKGKTGASSHFGKYVSDLRKNVRWNGYFSEIGEEYDEKLIQTLLIPPTATEQDYLESAGGSRWDNFFDPKEFLEIAGSISMTQLLMSTPVKVQQYYQSGKAKSDLKKTQSKLPKSINRQLVPSVLRLVVSNSL